VNRLEGFLGGELKEAAEPRNEWTIHKLGR